MQAKLHPYQEQCKQFIKTRPSSALFMDCGTGKTLTTLSALEDLNLNHHILVIAPKTIARTSWIDEIKKWDIQLNPISLIVNDKGAQLSKQKRHELYTTIPHTKPSIYFINRELLLDLVQNTPRWCFPTVVIDEMQGFKSRDSVRFKALKAVLPQIQRLIGLSGTPQPNGLMDLWAQIYLLDKGQRLGRNITQYRNTFFAPNPYILVNGFPVKYDPLPHAEQEIHRRIKDIVVSVKNTALQMPKLINNYIHIELDQKEKAIYNTLLKDKVLTFNEDQVTHHLDKNATHHVTASNAGVLLFKLQQMASGTLYKPQEEWQNKSKPEYHTIHDKKLDQLEHIINTTGDNILVLYHFKSDLDKITQKLTQMGFNADQNQPNYKVFDGKPQTIYDWNAGKINILLIQPQSAGHGINIQYGGHTIVWYTIPTSLEHYIQANARIYRQGQQHTVIVHHLVTKNTVDEKILQNLKNKDISQQALLNAVRQSLTPL